MAHAAIAFTDQGGFTGESITNIICPPVEHASNFEELRFMQEDLKAEKNRLQLLLNLTTQVSPDVELRQLLRTASATIRHITQCAVVAFHLPDKENSSLRLFALDTCNDGDQAVRQGSRGPDRQGTGRSPRGFHLAHAHDENRGSESRPCPALRHDPGVTGLQFGDDQCSHCAGIRRGPRLARGYSRLRLRQHAAAGIRRPD